MRMQVPAISISLMQITSRCDHRSASLHLNWREFQKTIVLYCSNCWSMPKMPAESIAFPRTSKFPRLDIRYIHLVNWYVAHFFVEPMMISDDWWCQWCWHSRKLVDTSRAEANRFCDSGKEGIGPAHGSTFSKEPVNLMEDRLSRRECNSIISFWAVPFDIIQ